MSDGARPLPSATARAIAGAYRPERPLGNYWDYFYVRAKLTSDPLYPGVVDALRGTDAPLLDLGCGLGLLAHALRDAGLELAYRGVDNDAGKVARATRAASRAGLGDAGFACVDLARGLPVHHGSVAMLDVLQFVPREAHAGILDAAVAMLTPGARLVIRTGFDDGGRRARVTRVVDVFSRVLGWMNTAPRHYPERDALCARLANAGLQVEVASLSGDTPFNNWRVVAHAP
ncbi:methyltransferase domain-containing protein [Marilutibacter chinensis]|uniref:Methyltransferase domain-containing protein n=1 Tax=Marilutibacter chinensis TaxID=2912247 RepID=A0ABS9HU03_9GAMM|nr:methyltransferase domain-containing protein [Lysobacter chinensis]MCF7222193.1 methyltransferase domain-containing protein [Lysobacter chinensis]